jgi:protein tyrosine/serine phosphatase
MKLGNREAIVALSVLLAGSVGAKAMSIETLTEQNSLDNVSLSAVVGGGSANVPAVAAPSLLDNSNSNTATSGLPDFAQVSPTLYRCGQPTQAGVAKLPSYGIKTILKLNDEDSNEVNWASSAGINMEPLLMDGNQSPSYGQVDQALDIINDASKQPVLVHCELGHDRTGTVVAAYRVVVQGWTIDKAVAEAKAMGYSNPNFEDLTTYLQGYVAHKQQPKSELLGATPIAIPNWSMTPGVLCTASDPNFSEYRYAEHVPYCNRNVTEAMKEQIAKAYGNIPKSDWSNYEFDHLLPLCIGGNSSIDNLWPQPHGTVGGSEDKDKLEDELYKEMAAGTITQKAAVQQIYDWFKGYTAAHPELPQAYKDKLANLGK